MKHKSFEMRNKQTFAIRKLTIGTTAVLLSSFIYGYSAKAPTVHADVVKSVDASDTQQVTSQATDSENFVPVAKQLTVDLNATVNAKDLIENNSQLPVDTTYSFKEKVDTATEGDKAVTVLVKTGSKTIEVNTTIHVNSAKSNTMTTSMSDLISDLADDKAESESQTDDKSSDIDSSEQTIKTNDSKVEDKNTSTTTTFDLSETTSDFFPGDNSKSRNSEQAAKDKQAIADYEAAKKEYDALIASEPVNPFKDLTSAPEEITNDQMQELLAHDEWVDKVQKQKSKLQVLLSKTPVMYRSLNQSNVATWDYIKKYITSGPKTWTTVTYYVGDDGVQFGQESNSMEFIKTSLDGGTIYNNQGDNTWRRTNQWMIYRNLPYEDGYYIDTSNFYSSESSAGGPYGFRTGNAALIRWDMFDRWDMDTSSPWNFTVMYHKYESYKYGQGTPLSTRSMTITEGEAAPDADSYISNYLPSHTASITGGPSSGSYPSAGTYTINIHVDYYDTSSADGTATLYVQPAGHSVSESKDITVTYDLTNVPSKYQNQVKSKFGGSLTKTETFKVTRSGFQYNNGHTDWNSWSATSHDGPSVPDIEGYSHTNFGKLTIDPDSNTSYHVTASYSPNNQTGHVYYIDDDDSGKTVKTVDFTGKTDETVNTNATLPDNYELASGAENVTTATMKAKDNDYRVHVKHKTQVIGDDGSTRHNVTRTITVHDPHSGDNIVTQKVSLKRTVVLDLVTKQRHNGDWAPVSGDGILPAYTAPTVAGYTPSKSIAALTVNGDTPENIAEDITYQADGQKGKIIFVDDDNGGKQVSAVEFAGKTDETVNTNATVPENYVLAPNQNVPKTVKMSGVESENIYTVHLKHGTSDVTGTDKGAHKTVTRTITVVDPHTGNKVTTQVAYLERQATKDMVTNAVTYGEWHKYGDKPNVLPSFTAPNVDGYTPNKSVDAITIDGNTPDNLSEQITYTANDGTQTINYVSGDTTVHTQKLTGVTDQSVPVTPEIPDGWELDNSTVPSSVTIKPSDTPINVNIKHVHAKVTHDAPKKPGDTVPGTKQTFPKGLDESDLNKTVTRTITIKAPKGKGEDQVIVQKIKFYRDADYDAVTHKITYTDWTGTGDLYGASNGLSGNYEFADIETAYIPGYMPVTKSGDNEWSIANNDYKTTKKFVISRRGKESTKITPESSDIQTVIEHVANKRQNTVNIFDDTINKQISSFTIEGQTDETVDFDPLAHLKSGYEFASGPKSYTFEGDNEDTPLTVHVKHGFIYDTRKDLNGNDISDLSKQVLRKIIIADPHKGNIDKTQAAVFSRTANVDKVTGEISYNPWSSPITLSSVEVPEVAGYTPTQKDIPSLVVNADSKPEDVLVTYVANDGTQTIKYVDVNGNKLVSTQVIKGKTDQKVLVKPEIPDGYVLKGVVPDSVTIEAQDTPLIVAVDHLHVHVPGPGKTNLPGTIIPGTNKKYPAGVDNDKLSKVMTRIINFVEPTGKESITQRVTFVRGADVDAITGEVKYDKWQASGTSDAFEEVTSPTIDGYTPSQDKVTAEKPDPNSDKDTTEVTVTYSANDGAQTIRYIDDTNKKVVGTTTIKGKTDETKNVPTDEVPDGYVLDAELPKTVTIKPSDKPIDISVHHLSVKVTPGSPKNPGDKIPGTKTKVFPKGVQDKDLHKTMTRVITLIKPTGKETITQTVKFERSANVDAVTGEVKYDKWQAVGDSKFAKVTPPTVSGYEPNPKIVDEEAPNPDTDSDTENVVVNYNPVQSQQTVQYVDKDGNIISTQIVTGKVDQSVPFVPSIPSGWVLDSTVPDSLTIKAVDNPIRFRIKHQIDHVLPNAPTKEVPYDTLNKIITRIIKFELPDGTEKVIKQTVHFQRDAYYDHVTLETTFDEWKTEDDKDTGIFERVDSPKVDGYDASMDYVPEITVNPSDKDSVVEVKYTKQAVKAAPVIPTKAEPAAPIVQPKNVELPQTGNENSEGLAMLGLTLTVASLGVMVPRKKN